MGWGADKPWIPPIQNPQTVSEITERHNLASNAFSLLSNISSFFWFILSAAA